MSPADEVIEICRDLLRIDTTNTGEPETTVGERLAAEYVARKLTEAGIKPEVYESEPGRASVVARVAGTDPTRPALLIHGHLDVVPADPAQWRFPPFAGEIADGYLWGRGAVDMKNFVAMVLAVVLDWGRRGYQPPRDVVLAFTADEEAGARGAHWLVETHPELFEDCDEAIGEVGGFSVSVGDKRLYLIESAQKGIEWMRFTATGRAGHGSMIHDDNAVTAVCDAALRVAQYPFPITVTPIVRRLLAEISDATGLAIDPDDPEPALTELGPISRLIRATIRNTANPTMLEAGYKANVIPGKASATIDGRSLPGQSQEYGELIKMLAGEQIDVDWIQRQPAIETEFAGPLVEAMADALHEHDPQARAVPYMLSGGTDAQAFNRLGVRCFGFAPLLLPSDLDFTALFHGVDERVPLDGLRFGVRVLDTFLARI